MKVLVAVDHSRFSEQALGAVPQIAPKGTEVRILHVLQPITIEPPPQMSGGYAPELEKEGKEAQKFMGRAAESLASAGFKVDTVLRTGDVRLEIVDMAVEWSADLVVVGSHGRSGIPRLLLGSKAEYVARHSPCSVLIVRTPKRQV
jgi:nucleotide-binding universal stress UspA family protein